MNTNIFFDTCHLFFDFFACHLFFDFFACHLAFFDFVPTFVWCEWALGVYDLLGRELLHALFDK